MGGLNGLWSPPPDALSCLCHDFSSNLFPDICLFYLGTVISLSSPLPPSLSGSDLFIFLPSMSLVFFSPPPPLFLPAGSYTTVED